MAGVARRRSVPLRPDSTAASESAADAPSAESLAPKIVEVARAQGWTLGVAESLTGGLVAAALISVPGASAVVRGGVVAYAPDLKCSILKVPELVIDQHGTVSRQCAEAMSQGACEVLGATFALSTTGVAGPEPSEGQPPGTVHLAVCARVEGREEATVHQALHTHGSRSTVRAHATQAGLSLLLATLGQHGPPAQHI